MSSCVRISMLLFGMVFATPSSAQPSAEQILERTREIYASLSSYSDEGRTVVEEKPIGATVIREEYTFVTRFSAPKRFYFESRKASSGERFVVWSPRDTFNSWWSATGVHESYAAGEGVNAFAAASLPTAGSALLIPALLFASAGLQSPLLTMEHPKYAGTETIDGRSMHKITAPVRLNHWSDTVRVTTVWIDSQSGLIHRVFEDTPSGMGGAVQRTTTTLTPRAGVPLEDAQFRFAPPRN